MSNLPRVGIIGGAGPMAGALFFETVIKICQKQYGAEMDGDFPYMLLINYPFTDMLSSPNPSVSEQLQDCLNILKDNAIDIAAIACNTLHAFLNPADLTGIGFINLITETERSIRQNGIEEVASLLRFSNSLYNPISYGRIL